MKCSETLVTPSERGVTIKANWEKMMHTNALSSIINATEQMNVDVVVAEDAKRFHLDTAKELVFCLRQVYRYNASTNPSQVVTIDIDIWR